MKLADYLEQRDIRPSHFAEIIKVAPATVSRYINKERTPEPDVMQRIIEATGGLVTPNDFFELPTTDAPVSPPGEAAE